MPLVSDVSALPHPSTINRLIDRLPRREGKRFVTACEPVALVPGCVLCEAGEHFEHVYFPLSGFISLLTPVDGHPPLETGRIGSEGMLGVTLVLDIPSAPQRGVVLCAGEALRMPASQLRSAMTDSPALKSALKRYLYIVMMQLSRTSGCTRFHDAGSRLARTLLMAQDRVHPGHFHLTHQSLADLLGVQRGAVTIAANHLQKCGIIRYYRGEITIIDREALESRACACYHAMATDYFC